MARVLRIKVVVLLAAAAVVVLALAVMAEMVELAVLVATLK